MLSQNTLFFAIIHNEKMKVNIKFQCVSLIHHFIYKLILNRLNFLLKINKYRYRRLIQIIYGNLVGFFKKTCQTI